MTRAIAIIIATYLLLCAAAYGQTTRNAVAITYDDGAVQQVAPAPAHSVPAMGWNLTTPNTYSPDDPFIDALKQGLIGSWQNPHRWQEGLLLPKDADGWPLEGRFGMKVMVDRYPADIAGTYRFIAKGKTNLTLVSSGQSRIENLAYDPATDTTTASVIVQNATQLNLRFDGGYVRPKLLRPGYADDSEVFTKAFLELAKLNGAIGTLRFMDWNATNNSEITSWAQRSTPTSATFGAGVPYEYQALLCRKLGLDLWTCVPNRADRQYVRQLALLLERDLSPPANIYIERSNECWNSDFKQYHQNAADSKQMVALGNTTLTHEGQQMNPGFWMHYLHAERTAELKPIMGPRFQIVLAGHWGYGEKGKDMGYWTKQHIGHIDLYWAAQGGAKAMVDAISCAPYYKIAAIPATQPTTQQYLDAVSAAVNNTAPTETRMIAWRAIADSIGKPLFAYEGGHHITNPLNPHAWIAATRDPAFYEPNSRYLNNSFAGGFDRFMWFVACARDSDDYTWGATTRPAETDTPRIRAVQSAGQSYRDN